MASDPGTQAGFGRLSGLHVLNTRPAGQAAGLSEALRAEGARVSELPLIGVEPLPADAAAQRLLQDLDRYDAVFFVSANAAQRGLDEVAGLWPQWPAGVAVYAVGERTAAVLRAAALAVTVPDRADSEGLLALPTLQDMQGRRCLVVRGQGGRELLADTLRARGARVDVVELYRRVLPGHAAAQWQALCGQGEQPDCVILTSPDALRNWQLVAGSAGLRPTWLVVSPRLCALAGTAGARVIEAAGAGTDVIVSALATAAPRIRHLRQ